MFIRHSHTRQIVSRATLVMLCATAVLCGLAHTADITSNLILHYKLDEASGTVAVDSGPNALNGTYATGVTTTDVSAFTTTNAKVARAVNFNGGFHINLTQAAANLTNGQNAITMAAWVNPNANSTGERAIIEFKTSTNNTRLSMRAVGAGTNQLRLLGRSVTGDANQQTDSAATFPTGTFVHLVATYDYVNKKMTGYINGVPVINATPTWGATAIEGGSTGQPPVIAGQPNGNTPTTPLILCNDILDEMRVYTRVLTQADIVALMALKSTWTGAGGNPSWSTAANWDTLPSSSNNLGLIFPGTTAINANNDLTPAQFQLNQLIHTNTFNGTNTISSSPGNSIQFTGTDPIITQTGSANLNLTTPIDFAGATTVNAGGGTLAFGNQLTGAGNINITGASTVIVKNASANVSTYSGAVTTSANGTLQVDSEFGMAAVTVPPGGKLTGAGGNIGGIVTATGATVSPGDTTGQTATLTAGGLVLNPSSTLNFDLNDTPTGPNNDKIAVTGALTSGGLLNIVLGNGFNNQAGPFPKTYTLMTSGSPPTGSPPIIASTTGGMFHVTSIGFSGNNLVATFDTGAAVIGTWAATTFQANWSVGSNWVGGTVPAAGTTTTLNFPTLAGQQFYIANNDITPAPYILSGINLSSTIPVLISGNAIRFDGAGPTILQTSSGGFTLNAPAVLNANTTIVGGGTGPVTLASGMSGGGGLTQLSPLALSLSNAAGSTYSGPTTINAGTLTISNTSGSATGTGTVTLAAGTSLAGTGAISGAVTLNGNSSIQPGGLTAGTIGTLATGPLTFSSASVLNFDLGAIGSNDKIAVTGNLTLTGNLNINNAGAAMVPGTYTLFTYTGTATTQDVSMLAPPQFAYQLVTANNKVNLIVLNGTGVSTWAATSNPNFSVVSNWDTYPGSSATTSLNFPTGPFYPGINNIVGLNIKGITINTTGNSITGNQIGLQGAGAFVNQIAAGSFTVGTPLALNANALITSATGSTLTLSNTLSGTGGIAIPGPGTVIVTNPTNTFTGPTSVTGGILALQNTTGAAGIANNGVLGTTSGIIITGAEVQVNPRDGNGVSIPLTNLDRPVIFGNNGILNVIGPIANGGGTGGGQNAVGAWTINAVDAAPAVVRYKTTTNWTNYLGIPALTGAPANTLRLEINDGVAGAAGRGGIMDFSPAGSNIPCKVIFSGVNGGSPTGAAGTTNAGKFYLNNGPYVQTAGGPGLFFENVVQIVPGNGSRVLNTDITVTSGTLAVQGRGTGTNFEAGAHDLIISPNRTVRIKSGATLNIDSNFRNDQTNAGGVLLMANTVIEDNATLAFVNSSTRTPMRMSVVGGTITGSGPNSTLTLNMDTHEGGYNPINTIATDGILATVTTDQPHGFSSGDFVTITHNETEAGAGVVPVPAILANTLAGTYQVTVNPAMPNQFTYNNATAAGTTVYTTKPVAGLAGGAGFASATMPLGNANLICNLVVNGGLVVTSNGVGGADTNQNSPARISRLLSAARLSNLTGTGGFLAPKPNDNIPAPLQIPNGWATAVPVKLLVSHNVPVGTDIQLGGQFNNDIVVGQTPDPNDVLATLDGNGQQAGGAVRGFGTITGKLIVTGTGSIWPGSTSKVPPLMTADESMNLSSTANVDLSAGGKLKVTLTKGATINKQFLNVASGGVLTLGPGAILSVGYNTADFGNGNIPIVVGAQGSSTITAPFGLVQGLPPGWTVKYFFSGAPITGAPSAANPADTVMIATTTGTVTPVTVGAFAAQASGAGVLLTWDAHSEYQNAGFNVHRRAVGQTWTRVNPALIAGRITAPDHKAYSLYDWAAPGAYEYGLESVGLDGLKDSYAELAGPVTVDALDAYSWTISASASDTAIAGAAAIEELRAGQQASAKFAAMRGAVPNASDHVSALAFDAQGHLLREGLAQQLDSTFQIALSESSAEPEVSPFPRAETRAVPAVNLILALRAFARPRPGAGSSFIGAKVVYDRAGVLRIPKASLPLGFDINRVSIQREGRSLTALALTGDSLIVYGAGYEDDYTNKDAIFLRATAARTSAGSATRASGLFASAQPVNSDTPATASVAFHDVYFDYDLRPYDYPPWFSNKYLTSGTSQRFALDTPAAAGGPAALAVNLWSLTPGAHALQVLVNGNAVGQAQWSGGAKMMQLSFNLDAGVLMSGANEIQLVTPQLGSAESAISFLHSMTMAYTRSLDGRTPQTVRNAGTTAKLYEVGGLAAVNAWVVDVRYPDRAALVPYETQAQGDGTYRLRFQAAPGGSGQFLVVPAGMENVPLAVSKRSIRPLALAGSYLATGPSQFAAGVQPLLQRRSKEGVRGNFVDQEQLFDYYGYGRYGPGAIQTAVRAVRPQYLLLVGRTTTDYKNYSGLNVDPLCPAFLVPTSFWAQATSDSMFGDLGRGFPEVAVGRLPVNTTAELGGAVAHILANKGLPISGVRAHAVSDQSDGVTDFAGQADSLALSSPEMAWQRNYLGVTYASASDVTASLQEAANGGADLLLYVGHGNAARLGREDPRIAEVKTVQSWTGTNVFIQLTCTANWMAKNESGYKSIAIQALTQPQGGISASIGTSTYMRSDEAVGFAGQLLQAASRPGARWGGALLKAQQWAAQQGNGFHRDLMLSEQIFGDPAMPVYSTPKGAGKTPVSGQF